MGNIDILRADINDTDDIMNFLKDNFKERKSYYSNRDFFINEFSNGDYLNFFIAKEKENILAVSSYYELNNLKNPDILSGIWCSKKSDSMTGLLVRKAMLETLPYNTFCGITTFKSSLPSHKRFCKNINKFTHYHLKVDRDYIPALNVSGICDIKLKKFLDNFNFDGSMVKSYEYIVRRYAKNQFLNYIILACSLNDNILALAVFKKFSDRLIIVDYIGDEEYLKDVVYSSIKYLKFNDISTVEFLNFGFDEEKLEYCGFNKVDENDTFPFYYNSLYNEKVEVYSFSNKNIKMTRGDGILEEI